jgi:hypothetical protein
MYYYIGGVNLIKKCLQCSKEFETKRVDKGFCSRSCYKKYNYSKNNPLYEVPCKGCGKMFFPKTHNMVFCSDECRNGYFNVRSKDDMRFGGNRKFVLERDHYKCVICGNVNGINVHHKDESGNSERPNNEPDNLITLCNACHIKMHNIHRKRTRKRINVTCQNCGRSFETTEKVVADGNGKYCSKKCQYAAMSKRQMSGITAICQICGKEFPTTPYKLSLGKSKYCNVECKRQAQIGVPKPKPITKQMPTNCLLCGKEFSTTQDRLDDGRGKYCSKQCMYKSRSIAMSK